MDGIYFGSYIAASSTTISLSAASFGFSAKTVQNSLTANLTSPALNFDGQGTALGVVCYPGVASFGFSAKTVQNSLTANLTSPALNFDGQAITRGAVWFLDVASFGFTSADVAVSQTIRPTSPTLNITPNTQTPTLSLQQDAPLTFDWVGQPIQNTTILPLSAPAFGFVGKVIDYLVGITYPLTAGALNFVAQETTPTLTIELTAASFRLQSAGNLELVQDGVPMNGPLRLLPIVGVGL